MKFRAIFNTPSTMIRVGSLCLILAMLALHFENRIGINDAETGFLYGIAIGCLLRGVWLNGRRGGNAGTRPCGF
jgi:hypothetical protein